VGRPEPTPPLIPSYPSIVSPCIQGMGGTIAGIERRAATAYRSGQSVWVAWRGRWWLAEILRAENGRSYVDYACFGSEWNEWVGPDRVRTR